MPNFKKKTVNNLRNLSVSFFLLPFWASFFVEKKRVGGQAVIEGVMMRSPEYWGVVVRGIDGQIHRLREPLRKLPLFLRLPFIRGSSVLVQSITLGLKAINFSAQKAYKEEKEIGTLSMAFTFLVAFVLGMGLFLFVPLYITRVMGYFIPLLKNNSFVFNLFEGFLRVTIFVLYIIGIGLWKEMRRLFEYHGAEHKVIHAYEDGKPLLVEYALPYSPQHPRCGTSFLLIVMLCSILVFSFIPPEWSLTAKFFSRVLLIPVVTGISYELLRVSVRKKDSLLLRPLIMPGILLQRFTTRQPDRDQLEIAILALKEVL
jgi:uncharacterized protein YqhQ